jgi:hypothetical protein
VSLIYFHRFLIFCFILFSIYFAWYMFREWQKSAEVLDILTSIFFVAAAVGFGIYIRTVKPKPRKDTGASR